MNFNIQDLSRCTGFPPQTLQDFANRGLLPASTFFPLPSFNGIALLGLLEEIAKLG